MKMIKKRIIWEPRAHKELVEWISEDKKKALHIFELIKSITSTPFKGIGKPEPLKYDLIGWWSRRIDRVNRFVYSVTDDAIIIMSCKYHYEKR